MTKEKALVMLANGCRLVVLYGHYYLEKVATVDGQTIRCQYRLREATGKALVKLGFEAYRYQRTDESFGSVAK